MCELPLASAELRFYSVAAPVIWSPPQQIHKASIFARWWSTSQEFNTKQIEWDRKSDTNTTENIRIKHSALKPDHISLNLINKTSVCVEPGLKSTDLRFSEATVAHASLITTKSHSLATQAVQLWNASDGCWRTAEHRANMQQREVQKSSVLLHHHYNMLKGY